LVESSYFEGRWKGKAVERPERGAENAAPGVAHATGWTLSAGVSGRPGQGRVLLDYGYDARARGDGDTPADRAVRLRCRDRLFGHSGCSFCAGLRGDVRRGCRAAAAAREN